MPDELLMKLEQSLSTQLELLENVLSSTAEVMQSRTQVGEELAELERQADKLSQHAEKAIFLGSGDLAKEARARQASVLGSSILCRRSTHSCEVKNW